MSVALTGNTVRKRQNGQYTHTHFGEAEFSGYRNTTGKMEATFKKVVFSDRSFSLDNTDKTLLKIRLIGGQPQVVLTSVTWNVTYELENVKVFKEDFGYFITGEKTDSRSTTYFIISIYDEHECLI